MPKKNNDSKASYISIHSYVDGFSFFTPNGADFVQSTSFDAETKQRFESLIHYSPEKKSDHILWVCHDGPALFIPQSEFVANRLEDYWALFAARNKANSLAFDQNEAAGFNILYEERSNLMAYLKSHAKTVERTHYLHWLYHQTAETLTQFTPNKIYIHFNKKSFDILVFKNNQLELTNTFELVSEETFLYFLFYVVEQMQWEPDTFTLLFLGQFDTFSAYYEASRSYQNNIEFINADQTRLEAEQHPAPFLATAFL